MSGTRKTLQIIEAGSLANATVVLTADGEKIAELEIVGLALVEHDAHDGRGAWTEIEPVVVSEGLFQTASDAIDQPTGKAGSTWSWRIVE